MPRNGSNVYSQPAGTVAVSGTTIESAKFNAVVSDISADLNLARPLVAGGTGATTPAGARTALGLEIGTNVQAQNANLQAEAGLVGFAESFSYYTGPGAKGLSNITPYGRELISYSTAPLARSFLGLGSLATANIITTAQIDAAALRLRAEGVATPLDTEVPTVLAMTGHVSDIAATKPGKLLGLGAGVDATGLAEVEFTGIPANAQRLHLMCVGLSLTASTSFVVQLGTSGAYQTTGYASGSNSGGNTTGFFVFGNNATLNWDGKMELTRFVPGANVWISSHSFGYGNTVGVPGGGSVSLSGEITRLKLVPLSGNFDQGSVRLSYELAT